MKNTRDIFADHDLRCTCQRVALYETLRSCCCHPTAEQLHRLVSDSCDSHISLATVYNTLEVLCNAGLARRLSQPNGCCRFDAGVEDHLHVWIPETDTIEDVPHDLSQRLMANLPEEVLQEIESTLGVDITTLNLQITARRRPQN